MFRKRTAVPCFTSLPGTKSISVTAGITITRCKPTWKATDTIFKSSNGTNNSGRNMYMVQNKLAVAIENGKKTATKKYEFARFKNSKPGALLTKIVKKSSAKADIVYATWNT